MRPRWRRRRSPPAGTSTRWRWKKASSARRRSMSCCGRRPRPGRSRGGAREHSLARGRYCGLAGFRPPLQPIDVLKHALADQAQEKESELGIVEIKLAHLVVGDDQGGGALDAFQPLGSAVLGREQAELTHHLARADLDA